MRRSAFLLLDRHSVTEEAATLGFTLAHAELAARAMYELIHEETREVIVQAFIAGANLTPKGAQTYFYNCKRKMRKQS